MQKLSGTTIPNLELRNMKKFIQMKIDKKKEPVERHDRQPLDRAPVVIQPPLPQGSPPRSPPFILTSPKKEIIEPEDQDLSDQELPDASIVKSELLGMSTSESLNNHLRKPTSPDSEKQGSKNDATNGEKSKICKDFLRNDCNRAHCIFRHEFDSTLLPKIYQFCKDFQNLGCKRPNCKFAHATVFEQERFYKTYVLPPNALAHQKKQPGNKPGNNAIGQVDNTNNYMVMIPPPPPPATDAVAYPPPVTGGEAVKSLPITMGPFPNVAVNKNAVLDSTKNNTNGLKRPWSDTGNINASPHSQDGNAKRLNECKHCQNMENRLFSLRVQYETMTKESSERTEKIMLMKRKQHTLHNLIAMLVKPIIPASPIDTHNIFSSDQDAQLLQRMDWLKEILNMQQNISKLTPEQTKYLLANASNVSSLPPQLNTWNP